MFRYIGVAWHPREPAKVAKAQELIARIRAMPGVWLCLSDSPGLSVLSTGGRSRTPQVRRFADDSGILLGTAFRRSDSEFVSLPTCIDRVSTTRVLATKGRSLFSDWFGRYVAFLPDRDGAILRVLVDPTGALPCHFGLCDGVHLFFCLLEDYIALKPGAEALELDWQSLFRWMMIAGAPPSGRTSFRGVQQLRGGECLEIDLNLSSYTRSRYWNPLKFAVADPIECINEASKQIFETTTASIQVCANEYEVFQHKLGGFDSSVVMWCFSNARPRAHVVAENYFSPDPSGDERNNAARIARHCRYDLSIRQRNTLLTFDSISTMRPLPHPDNWLYFLDAAGPERQLANKIGAGAFSSGWGGDQLFCQHAFGQATRDHLRRRGLRLSLLRVASDQARMEDDSFWKILRTAFLPRSISRAWSSPEFCPVRSLANQEALAESLPPNALLPQYLQQLIEPGIDLDAIGLGTLIQCLQLDAAPIFCNPFGALDDPDRLAPLFNQPLIELCLRIPVDVLTFGGWDRAAARRAFYDVLPRPIVLHRYKALYEEHIRRLILAQRADVLELLCDGELSRLNLIDLPAVERCLEDNPKAFQTPPSELMDWIFIEYYLQAAKSWKANASV